MLQRLIAATKTLTWILSASLAAVMASERLYWYWSGVDAESVLVLISFYAIGIATAFWALARTPGAGTRRAVLAGAVFALMIEGIVTPVIYEDGPLPVLFLMFVGWHGLLACVGFVYLIRRWALLGRVRIMTIAAVSTGVGWGVWALSSAVTDRETAQQAALDGGSAEVLSPAAFAAYAGWVGVLLVVAHLVMDRTWPRAGWRLSRRGVGAMVIVAVALGLLLVVPFVPWAPLKFGALAWLIMRLLRRNAAEPGRPTVIDELNGRIRTRDLFPVLLLPVAASLVYAALWPTRDHPAHSVVYWVLIAVQVVAGLVAAIWAIRRPGDRHRVQLGDEECQAEANAA